MTIITDWGVLLENLAMLPTVEPSTVPEEFSYLMEAIIIPLLDEQTVTLDGLDYDRFEEDKLDSLIAYLDGITEKTERLREIILPIEKLAPLCVSHPVFC